MVITELKKVVESSGCTLPDLKTKILVYTETITGAKCLYYKKEYSMQDVYDHTDDKVTTTQFYDELTNLLIKYDAIQSRSNLMPVLQDALVNQKKTVIEIINSKEITQNNITQNNIGGK